MGHKNKSKNKKKNEQTPNDPEQNEDTAEIVNNDAEEFNEADISHKRSFAQEVSDIEEDQPKKKKKKKQPVTTETSDKKGKKSIRQMKKEKHAQRQADASAAAKDQLKAQCISYLSEWKHNKQNWKFMKIKQIWLFKNKFSSDMVPDSSWPTLLEYFESAQGNIKKMLLEDSSKVIKQMDEWTESQSKEKPEEDETEEIPETPKPDVTSYKRARDLIQCLEE